MRKPAAVLILAAALVRPGPCAAAPAPAGPPCNGLVISLRAGTDPKHIHEYAGAMPVDLVMTNVAHSSIPVHPLPHLTGDFSEYIPTLVVFDAQVRGVYPPDTGQDASPPVTSGPGPQPPVQLGPGESVLYWFGEPHSVCTDLGLPAGRYVAQVVAPRAYSLERRPLPAVLVSNPLPFDWPGVQE